MRTFFILVIAVVVTAVLAFKFGETCRQNQIEQRAIKLGDRDLYNYQEVEIILFGEVQL